MKDNYKYFAFISYSHHDTKWGKRIQRKLESYRMPTTLCSKYGWERKPINPIFFAPTDIQIGGLTAELQDRLRDSRHLIVVCSPHSAQSKWVGEEIEYFHKLGRSNNIHFFIIDGLPNSNIKDTECFNPIIKELGLPEILGANIHEKVFRWSWLNRERAFVQLITKLLGVEFDSIWQRHRRLLKLKIVAWTIGFLVVITTMLGIWIENMPVDVTVTLEEKSVHNSKLPPLKNAIVQIALENEEKIDTLRAINQKGLFANVPHYFIGKQVHIHFKCNDWLTLDTCMVLSRDITLPICRDLKKYGNIKFQLWNVVTEKGVANAEISIEGIHVTSDKNGIIQMQVPLEHQKSKYIVGSNITLESNILEMPTTENSALIVCDSNDR